MTNFDLGTFALDISLLNALSNNRLLCTWSIYSFEFAFVKNNCATAETNNLKINTTYLLLTTIEIPKSVNSKKTKLVSCPRFASEICKW